MKDKSNKENRYRYLLKLTTLSIKEFMKLLSCFQSVWETFHRGYDLQGDLRELPKYKEHASMSLQGSKEKLLFVLVYLSQNPTQEHHGVLFSMSQGKVSQWLKILIPLLKESLAKLQVLPSRTTEQFYYCLKALSNYFILLDATERPIPRPVEYERQRYFYSGKQRMHTVKNNLISDKNNKILYLSQTVEGSLHDKALADEMELSFPSEGVLMQDLGYLGYEPEKVKVVMPVKKQKKQELSKEDKAYNKLISSMRVKVEHVMAGVKRLRTVKEKLRLRTEDIHDEIMLIACGIHNIRIDNRNLS
jgi:hypothetical protein